MDLNFKNIVDNKFSHLNSSINDVLFFHPQDKEKIIPFLVWPNNEIKTNNNNNNNNNDLYNCLNFLPIDTNNNNNNNNLSTQYQIRQLFYSSSFIQFQVIKDTDLIYIFTNDKIIIFKYKLSEWIIINEINNNNNNNNNNNLISKKSIHHYNIKNSCISIVSKDNNNDSIIYLFKNIFENSTNTTTIIEKISFNEIKKEFDKQLSNYNFSSSNNNIIDLKWSKCGLYLSILTSKYLYLLKWKSLDEIININKGFKIIKYCINDDEDNNSSDFIKFQWLENQQNSFIISTYPSIQISNDTLFNSSSNNDKEPILKLPLNIKPIIQIPKNNENNEFKNLIITNHDGDNQDYENDIKRDEILLFKPKNNEKSIPSLFMISSYEKEEEEEEEIKTVTSFKPFIEPLETTVSTLKTTKITETITAITTTTSKKSNILNKGPCLILFKIDQENQDIIVLDKLLLKTEISIPNIIKSKNNIIIVSSNLSKYIEFIKLSNNNNNIELLQHNKSTSPSSSSISLENNYSQYKIKAILLFNNSNDNSNSLKVYLLAGEKLNQKGVIGLSFKTNTDFKIALFELNEPLVIIESTKNENIPPIPINNQDLFLNFQNLIINKLNSIENTLNNHSDRLFKIEKSIDLITNHLLINK